MCWLRQAEVKLVHTMDMLGAFGALRVEVPLTTSRVPAALEALEGAPPVLPDQARAGARPACFGNCLMVINS